LTRLHRRAAVVKTRSMSRLESLQDMFEAGVSSKELAADMAITRRKSSVEVLQRHSQTSVDVFRRHSSLGVLPTFLCPLLRTSVRDCTRPPDASLRHALIRKAGGRGYPALEAHALLMLPGRRVC